MTAQEEHLDGQVAIVTGAGSGIGRAVTQELDRLGATCVLAGRRKSALEETAAMLSAPATVVPGDLTDRGVVDAVVEAALDKYGRIDLVVHSAGVFEQRDVPDLDREFWSGVIDINLTAVMELSRKAWSALIESSGQMVLISSIAADQAFPGDAAYAASKAGLKAFGEVMAVEANPHGIRIITLCPGQVDTPLWDGKAPDEVRERMMRPAAVAHLIASFIVSDRGVAILPVVIRPPVNPWQAP